MLRKRLAGQEMYKFYYGRLMIDRSVRERDKRVGVRWTIAPPEGMKLERSLLAARRVALTPIASQRLTAVA